MGISLCLALICPLILFLTCCVTLCSDEPGHSRHSSGAKVGASATRGCAPHRRT